MATLTEITKDKAGELKIEGYKWLEQGLYLLRGKYDGQKIVVMNARKKVFSIRFDSEEEINKETTVSLLNQYWDEKTKLDYSVEF